MKINKLLVLALTLVLMTPTLSFAEETLNFNNREKLNILQVVEKYYPEKLEEWEKVINERMELKKELKESKKGIIDSKKTLRKNKGFIGDLKAKENNEKNIEYKGRRCREKGKEKFNENGFSLKRLKRDLLKALSEGDEGKVKAILDKIFVKYQEGNKKLKDRLNKV